MTICIIYIVHGPKSYLDILDYAVYVGAHPVAVLAYLWRLNNIFLTETIWGSSPGSENYLMRRVFGDIS